MLDVSKRKREVVDRLTTQKASKEESNYRPQRNPDSKETCFDCKYYTDQGQPESPCEKVAGIVEAEDVCDYFEARTEDSAQPQIQITIRS